MAKIIFFGTPEFVVPIAQALHKKYNWANNKNFFAVVTQPPTLIKDESRMQYSPIDKWAYEHKLEIHHGISELPHADLGIVAAYGNIIPERIINNFTYGILNIHPSLLPKYRGASPIQEALKNGDTQTGVTIIKMDKEMDHGPIVSQFKEDILEDDTNVTLRDRLFEKAADFLIELIPHYLNGKIKLKEQDESEATFTKLVKREDGYVDIQNESPIEIQRKLKAYTPWPGTFTKVKIGSEIKTLKILKCHVEENKLVLDEVQLEGRKKVSFKQFQEGYPNFEFTK